MKINKKDSNTLEIETSTLLFKLVGVIFLLLLVWYSYTL